MVRLHAFRTLDYLKLHALVLVQRLETWQIDGLVMNEYVVSGAVIDGDEAKPLSGLNHLTVPRVMLFSCKSRLTTPCGGPWDHSSINWGSVMIPLTRD